MAMPLDEESPIQAVCGKAARTDLCGGARDEKRVPTATPAPFLHHAGWQRGGYVASGGANTAHGLRSTLLTANSTRVEMWHLLR